MGEKLNLIDILKGNKYVIRAMTNEDGTLYTSKVHYDNYCGVYGQINCPRILQELLLDAFKLGEAKAKNDLRKFLGV